MSIFVLKIIACISMILDHIKYPYPFLGELKVTLPVIGDFYYFTYLGRMAFPLFAFCIVEGYLHTKDLDKYIRRLFIAGLISQPFFMLFKLLLDDSLMLNIMFTFILGLLAIMIFDKLKNKFLGFLLALVVIAIGQVISVDYGAFGVATCFIMYLFRNQKIRMLSAYVLLVFVYYVSRLAIAMVEKGVRIPMVFLFILKELPMVDDFFNYCSCNNMFL